MPEREAERQRTVFVSPENLKSTESAGLPENAKSIERAEPSKGTEKSNTTGSSHSTGSSNNSENTGGWTPYHRDQQADEKAQKAQQKELVRQFDRTILDAYRLVTRMSGWTRAANSKTTAFCMYINVGFLLAWLQKVPVLAAHAASDNDQIAKTYMAASSFTVLLVVYLSCAYVYLWGQKPTQIRFAETTLKALTTFFAGATLAFMKS